MQLIFLKKIFSFAFFILILTSFMDFQSFATEKTTRPATQKDIIGYWEMIHWSENLQKLINKAEVYPSQGFNYFAFYSNGTFTYFNSKDKLSATPNGFYDIVSVFKNWKAYNLEIKKFKMHERPGYILVIDELLGKQFLWYIEIADSDQDLGLGLKYKKKDIIASIISSKTGKTVYSMKLRPIANQKIINIESEGNIQSNNPIACIYLKELTNKNTPADIFKGISKCIKQNDFVKGSELYVAAIAYGRFDVKRVEDKTAHQAISVLGLTHLSYFGEEKKEKFQNALNATLNKKTTLCNALKKIGKPNYYPAYMIQHGMGAFLNNNKSKDGLLKNFNSDKAWEKVLNNYIKCP
jgi:hypothetical protein